MTCAASDKRLGLDLAETQDQHVDDYEDCEEDEKGAP